MDKEIPKVKKSQVIEKELQPAGGGKMLIIILFTTIASIAGIVLGAIWLANEAWLLGGMVLGIGIVGFITFSIMSGGLKIIKPNEALVLTLFGNYYGTVKKPGFFFINPFAVSESPVAKAGGINGNVNASVVVGNQHMGLPKKKVSTKIMTLNNEKQKVNDVLGNPIIIGAVVIWNVEDPTKAVFNVENYMDFLSTQCDSTIRNIARLYPYDTMEEDSDEKTLRGSSQEIANSMKEELQQRVQEAGLNIEEVRITHLSYSEEIAAAMLQRQQAVAIIAARQKIVEGAVSMVKMAIDQLGEEDVVVLDEERKAAMVSNLLVVLCGNKDAQPIVNSGSIY